MYMSHIEVRLCSVRTWPSIASICSTRLPNRQPAVIPLRNQNRFLPRSKPLSEREVLLCEAIWPLWRCKKGKPQFYLPLSWTALGFLFIRRSLILLPVAPPGSFQTVVLHFRVASDHLFLNWKLSAHPVVQPGSFQTVRLYNQVAFRPSGCTTR